MICRGPRIVSARLAVAVCFGLVESVTVTLMLPLKPAVGVPVIWPAGDISKGEGKPVADQVYAVVPPVAVSVAL